MILELCFRARACEQSADIFRSTVELGRELGVRHLLPRRNGILKEICFVAQTQEKNEIRTQTMNLK